MEDLKMTESKFTPGPWITKKRNDGLENVYDASGVHDVCLCAKPANARLIAAAPEMLAVCKWVLCEIEWGHDMTAASAILGRIISKALGD
jgi:hypothetical protein